MLAKHPSVCLSSQRLSLCLRSRLVSPPDHLLWAVTDGGRAVGLPTAGFWGWPTGVRTPALSAIRCWGPCLPAVPRQPLPQRRQRLVRRQAHQYHARANLRLKPAATLGAFDAASRGTCDAQHAAMYCASCRMLTPCAFMRTVQGSRNHRPRATHQLELFTSARAVNWTWRVENSGQHCQGWLCPICLRRQRDDGRRAAGCQPMRIDS